ncbi:hypothetical protein EV44_g3426 [Erysiphe necator]|uniref:CCHC-type domain-containing protein n=1 Tax=Uncinula necator TaxID=52586 RepID=A0A0B1PAP8_UNCNE|nr:hypothetical protein EV44_g3426 [Erysiphe necator]
MVLSSKVNREILAQNIPTNEEKRAAKGRQLFGIESSGIAEASRYHLFSNHPQLNAKPSMGKRVNPNTKRSSPKGKAQFRPIEEDLYEDHELEWEEMPERNCEETNPSRSNSVPRTMLKWASFDWKPDSKFFLRVEAHWERFSGLKHGGGCPVNFVTRFKTEARNYQVAGTILTSKESCNTQIEKDEYSKKKQYGKGDINKDGRKIVRCCKCKGKGHFTNKCPKRNKETSTNNTHSGHIVPPAGLTNEYYFGSEDKASSTNYSAKLLPQHFENLVEFYDKETARRSAHCKNQESSEIVSPVGSINIAQQILSTSSMSSTTDGWPFDTGADIDAANKRINLVSDIIIAPKYHERLKIL